jgi:hypothetical protein
MTDSPIPEVAIIGRPGELSAPVSISMGRHKEKINAIDALSKRIWRDFVFQIISAISPAPPTGAKNGELRAPLPRWAG